MYIKPCHGYSLPDPNRGDRLPPEGREVPDTDFWQRRLRDGDVVIAVPPPEPVVQPPSAVAEPPAAPAA